MNSIEVQFYSLNDIPDLEWNDHSYTLKIFPKGEFLKSGATRLHHSLSFIKRYVPIGEIDSELSKFINENSEVIAALSSELEDGGYGFARVMVMADFAQQTCSFNLELATLKALLNQNLSIDVVVMENGARSPDE